MRTKPLSCWQGRLCRVVAAFLWALAAVGCGQPRRETPPATVLVRIAGSTSMDPALRELTRTYMQLHAHVQFDISSVGSSAGLELLRRGQVDLAAVSRDLSTDEEIDTRTGQRVLTSWTVAQDAIAIVVHPSNPVRQVSLHVLQQVFEGRVLNWAELGGPTEDATVVSREDGSGTREAFEKLAMRGKRVTPGAIVMPSSAAVRAYVSQHEGAIGYISAAFLGTGTQALVVGGTRPDRATLAQGEYPLTRRFLLVGLPDASASSTDFVSWVVSPAGQAVVARTDGSADTGAR